MRSSLWRAVTALARQVGRVQAWLLLSLLYFLVLGPVALLLKILADPLRVRQHAGSVWRVKPQRPDGWNWTRAQF